MAAWRPAECRRPSTFGTKEIFGVRTSEQGEGNGLIQTRTPCETYFSVSPLEGASTPERSHTLSKEHMTSEGQGQRQSKFSISKIIYSMLLILLP